MLTILAIQITIATVRMAGSVIARPRKKKRVGEDGFDSSESDLASAGILCVFQGDRQEKSHPKRQRGALQPRTPSLTLRVSIGKPFPAGLPKGKEGSYGALTKIDKKLSIRNSQRGDEQVLRRSFSVVAPRPSRSTDASLTLLVSDRGASSTNAPGKHGYNDTLCPTLPQRARHLVRRRSRCQNVVDQQDREIGERRRYRVRMRNR